MTDTVLIQNNVAHEIWRGKTITQLSSLFHASIVAQMVETPSDTVTENDVWNGETFSPPPSPPPPPSSSIVPYYIFRERFNDTQKAALHTAMQSSWQIDDFVGLARAQNSINLASPTAAAAKAALVAAGILTQAEADSIFTP